MKKNGRRIDVVRFCQRGNIPVGDIGQIPDRIKNRVSVGTGTDIQKEPHCNRDDIRDFNCKRSAFDVLDQLRIIKNLLRITRNTLKAFAMRFNDILRKEVIERQQMNVSYF